MSEPVYTVFLFFSMVAFGVFLENIANRIYLKINKKSHRTIHFTLARYLFLLLVPVCGVILMTTLYGLSILQAYIIFALVGTFLEWLIGYSYHQIVGQRLWTYHRYSLNGYTSLLATPIWGLAGVFFLLLVRAFR
jgi:uncharacterized membrane protein